MLSPYNGYTGAEREAKQREMNRLKKAGTYRPLVGPCSICDDPHVPIEPHSEDYSKPYRWAPPAEYPVCKRCHTTYVHKRFANPETWELFKTHVRRGGYAREFATASTKREITEAQKSTRLAEPLRLPLLRNRELTGNEWWERLSTDPSSLTAASSRPRP